MWVTLHPLTQGETVSSPPTGPVTAGVWPPAPLLVRLLLLQPQDPNQAAATFGTAGPLGLVAAWMAAPGFLLPAKMPPASLLAPALT